MFSFWAFDFSRWTQEQDSIVDLSNNANYLSTTIPVASLERVYNGFMSMFKMNNANFFLSSNTPVQLFNEKTGSDIPFVIAIAINPLSQQENRTLLAKSNYASDCHTFEFSELANGSLQVKLFTDASNFLTFTSNTGVIPQGCHSVVFSYDPTHRKLIAFVNSTKISFNRTETGTYTHMKELPGTLYCFSCTPTYIGYADSNSDPSVIYNPDGTVYTGTDWTINNSALEYNGHVATYDPEDDIQTDQLYAWVYYDGENLQEIYTKVAPADGGHSLSEPWATLYNSDYTEYTGNDFSVEDDLVMYRNEHVATYDVSENPRVLNLCAWKYEAPEAHIYANRVVNPTSLYEYTEDKDLYTGTDWVITGGRIYYLGQEATYTPSNNTNTPYPNLTSYITNESGNISQPINSEVGIVSIVKDDMEEEKIRALSLLLCATMGINPYIN